MLEVPQWVIDEVHRHVQDSYPNEACGAVLMSTDPDGYADRRYQVVNMPNAASNPRAEYAWAENDHRALYEKMDRDNLEMWIIWHSHPETMPEPSDTDKRAAWHMGAHYLIFSSAGGPDDVWFKSWLCVEPGQLVREEVRAL